MAEVKYSADGFTPTDNPMKTGIMGHCPRCQMGHLFSGFLKLAPRCEVCGLDYSFADPADGPAFFAMTIAAVPALGFGVWFQVTFDLPLWAHLFTTLPLTVLSCMALLRPLKGWLVCSSSSTRRKRVPSTTIGTLKPSRTRRRDRRRDWRALASRTVSPGCLKQDCVSRDRCPEAAGARLSN